jgi:hypothetical protein
MKNVEKVCFSLRALLRPRVQLALGDWLIGLV